MKNKEVRATILQMNKEELEQLIEECMFTPFQRDLITDKRLGLTNVQLSLKYYMSEVTISRQLNKIYQISSNLTIS